MRIGWLAMAGCCSTAAMADEPKPHIAVTGSGIVMTAPDLATIEYRIVGEGATSDAAVTAMVAKRRRIDGGLAALDRRIEPRASEVAVAEVRGPECRQYGGQRLSTGACAILGYTATLHETIRTAAVKQAGTIVGLVGRLEGSDPRIDGFALADPGAAQRRAIAAALIDAKARAQAIAQGTGVTLGRLVAVSTGSYGDGALQDVIVTGTLYRAQSVSAPPPPPITVDLTPKPVETRAQVSVSYEIAP